ncbi:PREDICTED: peroxisomal membrane protein 2 [Nanorana parkeri]|uniref:peroxisomal membrane protein 2 n=1 Tax=Nanorana parkeri TaxID=125878 RepID=UPI00085503BC|nr:PREDICTED: peroxisomal membrane protein 2 [Nanorana parkeri]
MPAASKAIRELGDVPLHTLLLRTYLQLLHSRPVLTKALTSGILSALGNLLSQNIEQRRKFKSSAGNVDLVALLRFAAYGLFFTGPLSHYFYLFLEQVIPSSIPMAGLRRLLLERLIIAPAFLLLFFVVMNFLEGKGVNSLNKKLKDSYWSTLKMNWKVWTPFQFINVNYIPVQFRVLFANAVAFFWYTYLSTTRK